MQNAGRAAFRVKTGKLARAFLTVLVCFAPWAVAAQEIPRELLRENLNFCKAGCGQNNSELICEILCDCTVRQFDQNLSLDRYLRVTEAMETGKILPEDRDFLTDTAKICTAKLDAILPPENGELPEPR